MIVNEKSQLGITIFDNIHIKDRIFNTQIGDVKKRDNSTEEDLRKARVNAYELIYDNMDRGESKYILTAKEEKIDYECFFNTKTYLLKDEAQALAKKIPLDKFNYSILKQVADKKCMYLMGRELAFKFYTYKDNLYGVYFKMINNDKVSEKSLEWAFFRIDLETNEVFLIEDETGEKTYIGDDTYINEARQHNSKPLNDKYFKCFIQTLLFIELSDLDVQLIEPNKKIGKTKKDKIINRSKSDVIVVTSKWNVISVRGDSFLVNGHWRMQPCGINRANRKLIYVDTFEKKGYIKRSKKQSQTGRV